MKTANITAGAAILTLVYCSDSWAADYAVTVPGMPANITQSLVLDGSLGLLFTDNALATGIRPVNAGYVIPFLRLTYGLKTPDGWSYTVYARTTSESYTDRTADNAFATFGSTLSKTFDVTTVGVNFDEKFFFDGFYAMRGVTASDFSGFVTQVYGGKETGWLVVPRFTVGYRWADLATAERASLDGQLTVEKFLTDPWSIAVTGRLRAYWYHTALVGPVPVDVYPSASIGVKYDFGHDIVLTTSVAALLRRSNVAARNYERLDIGPSVDFKYKF